LKIDESKVDLAYLINELSADYVVNQLESVRMGSVIPYLRIADLLEIRIKLPSLKEQKAKALGALSAYKDSRFKESKLEDELNFIKAKFNEELREKQHCIRQHLKNVVDSIAVINSFMDKQNGTINRNDVINPYRNVTVAQRFEAMSNSIQSLSLEIDNLTNDELYDKPEIIGIRDIILECILEFGDTKGFSILESFDEFVLDEYGDNNPKFSVSKRSFKELFNNIVINASLHGFIDKKESVIKISVTIEEGKLKVTFLNNGKPLAVGMREHLGVKGKKAGVNAGSGIGVSKVIGIANHYGFEYRIIDLPEDEYPFGWEFKFTLTELN
jgi:type I restriction enzyme M protein